MNETPQIYTSLELNSLYSFRVLLTVAPSIDPDDVI